MRALTELPNTREGIMTLGMRDMGDSFDEDYLMVGRSTGHPGWHVEGYVGRPVPWVAEHLKREGALVASGVLVGYASAFVSYISRWPAALSYLQPRIVCAARSGIECAIPAQTLGANAAWLLRGIRWRPPLFPQRVLAVSRSGWNGLKSARSIARLSEFYRNLISGSLGDDSFRQYSAYAPTSTAFVSAGRTESHF